MESYFEKAFDAPLTRRALIKGVAAAGAATWIGTLPGVARGASGGQFTDFRAIAPSAADALQVPDGYASDVVIGWGDEFAPGLKFGYNCDYSAWFPLNGRSKEGLMWVNHEYIIQFFTSDWPRSANPLWNPRVSPYKEIMAAEKKDVGGSIVHLRRNGNGPWEVVYGSPYSRRFYADGPAMPYDGPAAGTSLLPSDGTALGTMANCSGATTPWGTVLTCEENYQSYGLKRGVPLDFSLGWIRDDGSTPEEVNYYIGEPGTNVDNQAVTDQWPFYGYVAEIDPRTGNAVKHTALGRIHHENVALRFTDGKPVVCYTGDDAPAADGMFFKFVSSRPYRRGMSAADGMKLLSEGQLYVAQWFPAANDPNTDAGTGVWHPLDMSPESVAFTTKWVEANIVPGNGGNLAQFRVPRAEDCEIVKTNERHVLISLTSARGRPADPQAYGIVRLLKEDSLDPHETSFAWVDLLEGGTASGFANPDNMAFGPSADDLWLVTDVSSSRLNVPGGGFEWFGNNAMFYVPLNGPNRNTAFRFANAPVQAELTGPTYVHEQKTLFLNVQHPGEETPNRGGVVGNPATYTSWWPEGNRTTGTGTPGKPIPSLVAIRKL